MSTIITLVGTDGITTANSMTKINANFANLNADKIETSVLDTDTALAANSDAKVATQKAVKAYIDALGGQTYLVPTGAILAYGKNTAPSNFLSCDGSAVSRSTYSTLFGIIGTTYGVGDGSSSFNVPLSKSSKNSFVFDTTSTKQQTSGTSATWSHTCSGANRLLVLGFVATGVTVSSVQYAGVNMTLIDNNSETSFYYLINPTLGANNIVVSCGEGGFLGIANSYNGIKQSSPLDAHAFVNNATTTTVATTSSIQFPTDLVVIMGQSQGASSTVPLMSNSTIRSSLVNIAMAGNQRTLVMGDITTPNTASSTITFGTSSTASGGSATFGVSGTSVNNYDIIKT